MVRDTNPKTERDTTASMNHDYLIQYIDKEWIFEAVEVDVEVEVQYLTVQYHTMRYSVVRNGTIHA